MMYRILTLFLSLELFLAPVNISLTSSGIAYAEDPECSQGMHFDSALNRCVMNTQVIEAKTEAMKCDGLVGDEFKKCFNDNVDNELAESEAAGDIKKSSDPKKNYILPAVVTLGAAYYLFKNKEALEGCGTTSIWLMGGAGVSTLLGEFMAQRSYKKKLSGMGAKYAERMQEKDLTKEDHTDVITSNQTVAYEFQIEQEKARQKAHKARKNTYNLAFGLYTAGTVAAIYEGFTGGWTSECTLESGSSGAGTTSSINFTPIEKKSRYFSLVGINKELDEYFYLNDLNGREITEIVFRKVSSFFISSAHANTGDMERIQITGQSWTPAQSSCGKKLDPSAKLGLDDLIGTPSFDNCVKGIKETPDLNMGAAGFAGADATLGQTPGVEEVAKNAADKSGSNNAIDKAVRSAGFRAALSGVLALYSKNISSKAGKLAKEAGDRISLLETLKEEFEATGGAGFAHCTEEDRRNPARVSCYCYGEDGQRNPARKNSATCQAKWKTGEAFGAATDYGSKKYSSSQGFKGCVRKDKQMDPGCTCKSVSNQGSDSSCMNLKGQIKLGQLGNISGLKEMMKDTGKFVSGNISTGELDQGSINRAAARLTDIKTKWSKDPKKAKSIKGIDTLQGKLNKNFGSRVRRAIANGGINPANFSGGLGSSTGSSPKDILKNVKKELAKQNLNRFESGGSIKSRAGKKNSLSDYDFGDSGEKGGVKIEDDMAAVMNKNYKFNDISERTDHNIFKIISNRYQRSGLRRLFDSEGKTQADEPNETDINER